jgi:hypothetical protein
LYAEQTGIGADDEPEPDARLPWAFSNTTPMWCHSDKAMSRARWVSEVFVRCTFQPSVDPWDDRTVIPSIVYPSIARTGPVETGNRPISGASAIAAALKYIVLVNDVE